MSDNIAILLLAAGNSSRLGRPKQFLDIKGEALLVHTVRQATQSEVGQVFVVVGYQGDMIKRLLSDFNVEIIENQHWAKGMGNSLKAGLVETMRDNKYDSVIVSVCDQPHVTATEFIQLLQQPKELEIIASAYSKDDFGPPTLFRKSRFDDMLTIDDRAGAKSLIKKYNGTLGLAPFEKGSIDIDTADDYQNYLDSIK